MSSEEQKPIFYIFRANDPHSAWDYVLKIGRLLDLQKMDVMELVQMLRRVADNIESEYLNVGNKS